MPAPPPLTLWSSVSCLLPQKCSEEKIEILQGKISLLEDQLAKLGDSSAQKGEVLGDVLKVRLALRAALLEDPPLGVGKCVGQSRPLAVGSGVEGAEQHKEKAECAVANRGSWEGREQWMQLE